MMSLDYTYKTLACVLETLLPFFTISVFTTHTSVLLTNIYLYILMRSWRVAALLLQLPHHARQCGVEAAAEKAAAERAAMGGGGGEDRGVEGGGGDGGGGEVYCTHARTHAAAADAAPAAADDDVDARAMRGGAAPTQRLTPLSGSSHHGEPLTAERLAGCSRLYIRQRRGGAKRASMHLSLNKSTRCACVTSCITNVIGRRNFLRKRRPVFEDSSQTSR